MTDVAHRIPPTIFCWMVGCDVERGPELAATSAVALQAFSGDPAVMDDVLAAIRVLRRFADELIEAKRAQPGDDITTALVAGIDDGALSHRDARSLLTELLSASVDNTTHSTGLALWLLCEHPDQWEVLAPDDALVERAVEECARYEPTIRHGNHVNDADVELLGTPVPAGTLVTVYLAAAHRDPDVYAEPDRFDVTRRLPQPQLTFGVGRHYCVGAALARMEIQEVLRAITARWRKPRLAPGVLVETALSGIVRELPVEFDLA
jgi:cytochrome P450